MTLFGWIRFLIAAVVLTMLTQIGGAILLFCLPFFIKINQMVLDSWLNRAARLFTFCGLYGVCCYYLVPKVAPAYGRILMPETEYLKPASVWYRILNRTYARPELADAMQKASLAMYNKYPGSATVYMDAGFPFFDGFPMLFHQGHNDGRRLDVGFFYIDAETRTYTNARPSLTGYGVFEKPQGGEPMSAEFCKSRGFGRYDATKWLGISFSGDRYRFDAPRTENLIRSVLKDDRVQNVLIEAHLEKRMRLEKTPKVINPDCLTVRHDDHFHVNMR